MKKLLLLLIYTMLPLYVVAQQLQEYNRKGDEAMARRDFSDAQMWYEEGVVYCDPYSIEKLTTIWLANEQMRPSMRILMSKCFDCLEAKAVQNDTTAISQLITYYTEGIGHSRNEELALQWESQLKQLQKPVTPVIENEQRITSKPDMVFFVGYAFSIQAPFGLTIGGMFDKVGWYVRAKTNASFRKNNYTWEKGSITEIGKEDELAYTFDKSRSKKINSYSITAGGVVRTTPWLYTSIGLGYGERTLLWPVSITDYDGNTQSDRWCKNVDTSYKGIAAEVDFMIRYNSLFMSIGCSTISFEYIDLNAGVGVFF
ncbi:hypothetical protein [Parabacteroides sp. PF5-9]|uniref:hypothetical protein n=1 Tax=Parabacteroides sp. PF5-9 TaxID=1742404 RepID=UPI002476896B|nr:hypothetical protein [Parabacteroides sp. PF5-9]MDH6356461.1 hypothetical protein [Parabacteroides sp. PF5-9]